MRISTSVFCATLLLGCGRGTTTTGFKLAGVGGNPDEIASSPIDYSGIISYDWVEFSGAALPLGLMGLVSFDGVAPDAGLPFEPPYAVVYASGLVMDSNLPATDALFGNFGVPPTVEGRCHTIYEPASYVSGLADVGSQISVESLDGSGGIDIGRRPLAYPPDVQDIFPTYLAFEAWREAPRYYRKARDRDGQALAEMEAEILNRRNFPFGEQTIVSFPGALPPLEATFSSIPMPSDLEGTPHILPTRPAGVMMTWDGPQYSADGIEVGFGSASTCMQFVAHDTAPASPVDCIAYQDLGEPEDADHLPRGQMYTAPWETDGGITFEWLTSSSDVDDVVSVSVRFLGPVDEDDDSLVEAVVTVPPSDDAVDAWSTAQSRGQIPEGVSIPDGRRAARVCEEPGDFEYQFDDIYRQGSGYIPSLQGSPLRTMAEVVCNIGDATEEVVEREGESYNIARFTLTADMLEEAITYGRQQGAMGAVFVFSRSTKTPLTLPPVRDYMGNRRNTGDVLMISNAVQMGRFWLGQDGL